MTALISALDALLRNEIEADGAILVVEQSMKRRVACRSLCRITDLQDVLRRVFVVEVKLAHGPMP
jgi:hypothetical protein